MPGAPLRPDQDRDALIAIAQAEGIDTELGADLDGAAFRIGWENVVLDTPDGWIIRFPRAEDVPFERELALLALLHDRLPVPIPAIIRTGRTTRFAVYRRLEGVALDPARFEAAEPRVRDRVAGRFGRFLAAMHDALTPAEIADLEVPEIFTDDDFFPLDGRLPGELAPAYQEARNELRQRLQVSPHRPVLLHSDFHLGNLVLDHELGSLAGVWDFSCVAVGDPSLEFRYLIDDSQELASRIASAYAARTGREVDLGLARAAWRLEMVSDALEEGRDPAPYLV